MKNNRMTLQDIANLAGLNKMTVSRYLRDPGQVSERSRELISKVMEENNYIPNRAPEILLNARSKTIGVLIPSFRNQIFADVLAGIESVTSAHQYQTLIANYEYDPQREEREVLNLLSYNIDGLILTGKQHSDRMVQYVRASGIPVAELMDFGGQQLDIQVGFDNEKAAWDMTNAFLESGKRAIAFFGSMDDPRDLSRFHGTELALAAHGLKPYHMAPRTISSVALGRQMFLQMQQVRPDIDAIFCTNDDLAVGVLLECQAQGKTVPQEMAIAGFHGLEIGRARLQKIASVITPRYEIGKTASEILIARLAGKDAPDSVNLAYQIYYGDTL
ncbi:DNA-binding transcriptional regulator IdnR [Klebsiella oxytoca]|uniref:DNA-binding transcriptional regulator IdnR n=1 Tax=Klebsiella oxytoca TaxID=571 RepID=UPI0007DAB51E|nr:substrate-binding domain-containing protein [Klebsiella oxytoca]ELG4818071.1 substrate-binding domain-containing protein [Klebsiella oxytoca]ELK5561044.1 substrate-binding domain-containing protein [Klebsiella oxytoca]ELK5570720.1 substrate-binding domain-containing protein [Klebsiella oxytoca]ELM1662991.1 substrate-binding domain-containing protein [Klebsiella oxytoca]MCW9545608.1 substrate-binding domain-containing protein [Klebsiella oxytoca]